MRVTRAKNRVIRLRQDAGTIDQGVSIGSGGIKVFPVDDTNGGTGKFRFRVSPKRTAYDIFNSRRVSAEGNFKDLTVADPATVALRRTFWSLRRKAGVLLHELIFLLSSYFQQRVLKRARQKVFQGNPRYALQS